MRNCGRMLAADLIEGMRDPDTQELEPGFNLPLRDCLATGCLALTKVVDNEIVPVGDYPCLAPQEETPQPTNNQ